MVSCAYRETKEDNLYDVRYATTPLVTITRLLVHRLNDTYTITPRVIITLLLVILFYEGLTQKKL